MHGQGSNRSKTKIEARKRGNIWIGGFDIQISRFARFPADLEHEFGLALEEKMCGAIGGTSRGSSGRGWRRMTPWDTNRIKGKD
jgi:hypothetical protein